MIRHTTIPIERAWNTWSSRPAEMVFLPLGVRLAPVAYAASTRTATAFPAGTGLTFGRHALDGSLVELELTHAGTRLAWSYAKSDPFVVTGEWRASTLGEWGLRFWLNLAFFAEDGTQASFDAAANAALLKIGHRWVALVPAETPVQVTGHADIQALCADYEANGYFHLGSRSTAAPLLACRFNLEMMREGRFALAVADSADLAIERARNALALPPAVDLPTQEGLEPGALDAVRDVMAWNSVYDPINHRPYTAISRNWDLGKFGGFGVWLTDQLYNALLTGYFDQEMARENLAAALASRTPEGNFACLLTANDAWVDRSQLPLASFLVWLLHLRTGNRAILEQAYATLAANHLWWWANRDPDQRGLVSYGTSKVGEGLYKGSHFGARNESSMDNSPVHDEARFDRRTGTLSTLDVGINSILALDAEMLAKIARVLGKESEAERFAELHERTCRKIETELWDETRGIFANRQRDDGSFVHSLSPTSFYPLACGAATPAQLERLLQALDDPERFAGPYAIPGTARADPAAKDNSYWRGRIWAPMNWLVWHGLRRYGREERARDLAMAGMRLFRQSWDERRLCPENFNAETGEALDQPDTEGFYAWGALLPALGVAAIMDVNPWGGFELTRDGQPFRLGPLQSPLGSIRLEDDGRMLRLWQGERLRFWSTLSGRHAHLRLEPTAISVELPEGAGRIGFGLDARGAAATLDGQPIAAVDQGCGFEIAAGATRRVLTLHPTRTA